MTPTTAQIMTENTVSQTYRATYSPDDNKLRLYASLRLDEETYSLINKAGFRWAPKQELFVAPAWTPGREDVLLSLAGDIEDEDSTLFDRQEQRAGRFSDYSDRRAVESEQALAHVYGSTTYCNFYSHVKYSPLASSVRVIYVAFCCYTAPDIQPFFD
ncbi:Uncharacterised protein [Klebsiella pneumoniae]|nr:Uncharacterised protein [Klebsiella pneumoniae]